METKPNAATAIEARGLSKRFRNVVAVDDLSFDIPTGKVTGFLGPNGAGKSTTLRMILGLVQPDAGDSRVLGRPFVESTNPLGAVGPLLDLDQFHPLRTGRNHLKWLAQAGGIRASRIDEVLELVELADAADRKVGGYSLGMKQRLGLAAALLGEPEVLVLDEPANGLDPAGIRWLRNFLRGFAAAGGTVFVSSHLLAEMAEMADDVVVIDKGRLVTHAPVVDLLARTTGGVRVVTPQPERLADLFVSRAIEHERIGPDTMIVAADGRAVGTIAAEAGIPIFGLEDQERSLEDVFFELTSDAAGRR